VGPFGVVLDSPRLNQAPGMAHGGKPVLVQTFIPETAVETFNVKALRTLHRHRTKRREQVTACRMGALPSD